LVSLSFVAYSSLLFLFCGVEWFIYSFFALNHVYFGKLSSQKTQQVLAALALTPRIVSVVSFSAQGAKVSTAIVAVTVLFANGTCKELLRKFQHYQQWLLLP